MPDRRHGAAALRAIRSALAAGALALLAACAETGQIRVDVPNAPTGRPGAPAGDRVTPSTAIANFRAVVARVEPVAEATCRADARPGTPCDFRIVVDDRRGAPPNAFQTLDRRGRPVIGFTVALIADARNQDELAFIMGHEAAHHILGHIPQARANASAGGLLGAAIAAAAGADRATVEQVARASAQISARRFAKEFELQADAVGTVIGARAGYDPLVGVRFFDRLPDPGDRFLGTHPPNADRVALVRRVAAGLGAGS